ncbi:Os01g0146900 [Oryza sativa Japonica Group]|uniref:Os01g0146900 protein n=1 Tax=Oryza sativa subsp. japonica TaxID=39947 RepID=A0A0P0UYA1_ORYSJ|nr:Os01g0146900 [Oryza sativa Japonica Group]
MAIPPALARRESEHDGAASSNIPAVLLVLGVATVSVAINNTAAAATNYHCSLAFAISLAGGIPLRHGHDRRFRLGVRRPTGPHCRW